MPKISRQTMKMFGSSVGGSDIGIFGSLAAGSPTYSNVILTIQSLPAWSTGWAAETIGGWQPALEDMNAVCHVLSYGVSYIHQMGIPEYDAATTYYENSYCQVAGTVYYSLQDNNTNNAPASSPTYWTSGIKGVAAVPSGGIIMWSGSLAAAAALAPDWYVCDGSNGTPDLRDRFIVCASVDDSSVAKTVMTDGITKTKSGASNFASHTHTATVTTARVDTTSEQYFGRGWGPSPATSYPTDAAGSGTVTYPPYYALAFIMKS